MHAFNIRSAVTKFDFVSLCIRTEQILLQLAGGDAVHIVVDRPLEQGNGDRRSGIVIGGRFVRVQITKFHQTRLKLLNRRVIVVFLKNRILRNQRAGRRFGGRRGRNVRADGRENGRLKRNRRGRDGVGTRLNNGDVYGVCAGKMIDGKRNQHETDGGRAEYGQYPCARGGGEKAAAGMFFTWVQSWRIQSLHLAWFLYGSKTICVMDLISLYR